MEYMSKYIYDHFREVIGSKSKELKFLSEYQLLIFFFLQKLIKIDHFGHKSKALNFVLSKY